MPRWLRCSSAVPRGRVAEPPYRVALTDSFLERLASLQAFLEEAGAEAAFGHLVEELRGTVIPNLGRFPHLGRPWLSNPPQSVEALDRLAALPAGAAQAWREYLHGDYLILYTVETVSPTVFLLSIRHHRELSFDFARLWPALPRNP